VADRVERPEAQVLERPEAQVLERRAADSAAVHRRP